MSSKARQIDLIIEAAMPSKPEQFLQDGLLMLEDIERARAAAAANALNVMVNVFAEPAWARSQVSMASTSAPSRVMEPPVTW